MGWVSVFLIFHNSFIPPDVSENSSIGNMSALPGSFFNFKYYLFTATEEHVAAASLVV